MIQRTFHTPGELALDLTIPTGSVDVETIDGDETYVELVADDERDLEDARVELRRRGSGHELVVDVERRRTGIFGRGLEIAIEIGVGKRNDYRLHVRCPHGAALDVHTAAADVNAAGRYASAEVKTATGDVSVGEVSGDAALKTATGDVHIARVGGEVRAQLVSGDLDIIDAARSVTVKSVSGDQHVQVTEGRVQLTSVSGDIKVAVRRGSRVYIDATSVNGDLDSELELAEAPSGGEGPLVELTVRTVNGDFHVIRAREATRTPTD
jgi:Putative adhesin